MKHKKKIPFFAGIIFRSLDAPCKTISKASVSPGTHPTKWLVRRGRHIDNSRIVAQHKKAQHLKPEERQEQNIVWFKFLIFQQKLTQKFYNSVSKNAPQEKASEVNTQILKSSFILIH